MQENAQNASTKDVPSIPEEVKLGFDIPDIKEFLSAGAQFGHQTKRWNPKMKKYIFTKRGNIHIIDLAQTIPLIEDALKFLVKAASRGRILMVGTKRQIADILKDEAVNSGSYFIHHRWPGGLLTNFKMITKSFKTLQGLEETFSTGIEGRTKYEISRMKKDWERLNRLYVGVKTMDRKPQAVIIIDPNYEKNAIREALATGVPIVSIVDTNCDPEGITYPIPANDDAVKSVKLIMDLISKAIKQGNGGKGVVHEEKDFTKIEVKIIKKVNSEETIETSAKAETPKVEEKPVVVAEVKKPVVEKEVKATKPVKKATVEKKVVEEEKEEKPKKKVAAKKTTGEKK